MHGTYGCQKLHHRIARLSTDTQPILYPIHTPFHTLVWGFEFDPGSVNTQEFDRFRVPTFSLVDGNEVKYSVVSDAVYGESKTDSHEERIEVATLRSRVGGICAYGILIYDQNRLQNSKNQRSPSIPHSLDLHSMVVTSVSIREVEKK